MYALCGSIFEALKIWRLQQAACEMMYSPFVTAQKIIHAQKIIRSLCMLYTVGVHHAKREIITIIQSTCSRCTSCKVGEHHTKRRWSLKAFCNAVLHFDVFPTEKFFQNGVAKRFLGPPSNSGRVTKTQFALLPYLYILIKKSTSTFDRCFLHWMHPHPIEAFCV
jgi:hypothetical protein